MGRLVLVTGGARSGKSRFAESRLAELAPPPWLYVATCEPRDDELRARVRLHVERRGDRFRTVEAPRDPAAALRASSAGALLDCVTLWLTNLLLDGAPDEALLAAVDDLAAAARAAAGPTVLVTNEVGAGIVPDNALARRFRDLAGLANQRLAAASDEAHLVVSGLPVRLK
jgi:adenosyl cobinamide kinase/adenosyl cobinamide phosphate guanylyltransferase